MVREHVPGIGVLHPPLEVVRHALHRLLGGRGAWFNASVLMAIYISIYTFSQLRKRKTEFIAAHFTELSPFHIFFIDEFRVNVKHVALLNTCLYTYICYILYAQPYKELHLFYMCSTYIPTYYIHCASVIALYRE